MLSDEELKELHEELKEAAPNYACFVNGKKTKITKQVILDLIHEVQDRRVYSNEIKHHLTGLVSAEAYLAPYIVRKENEDKRPTI